MDGDSDLIKNLLRCDIFKIGNFKLKSGSFSPIYIDLRQIINHPHVIRDLAKAIQRKQEEDNIKCDVICGVPYTALPIASVYSVLYDVPMLIKRKEQKDHGTKKMVEGNIIPGNVCLILEDIVSSGTSVIETAETLRKEKLTVKECIVIVNRNQGGRENLEKKNIKLHQLFDVNDIFNAHCSINRVEEDIAQKVKMYFEDNSYLPVVQNSSSALRYEERSKLCTHGIAKKLFKIMEEKQTNLCVAVDTNSSDELLRLAFMLGPCICVLKTHVDILEDFSQKVVEELTRLSELWNFLIFEDRKFADIGNTVKNQFEGGMYKIQSWADMVSVHAIPGEGILEALKNERCASVLIAEMSSKGTLTSDDYKDKVLAMAEKNSDFVIGYVAQKTHPKGNFIHMCPGINIASSSDSLGQQYKSPEEAVANGADIIIVGRGICSSPNILNSCIEYQTRGFDAYMKRISHS